MPALNFQAQFAPLVESGEKRQTIRLLRKDGRMSCFQGDTVVLYTGMRTKGCRKLLDATCESIDPITIKANGTVKLCGQVLHRDTVEEIARADGFSDKAAMMEWFEKTHDFPFIGYLIRWSPNRTEGSDG